MSTKLVPSLIAAFLLLRCGSGTETYVDEKTVAVNIQQEIGHDDYVKSNLEQRYETVEFLDGKDEPCWHASAQKGHNAMES
jgi:hypothetical protein